MTAEILIMNTGAVALAADSAVTIGSSKVYNSANKLFALSKRFPVGIMIYGSADLMGVPWETLIKHYRQAVLKARSFASLGEYADDFLKFLATTSVLHSDYEEMFVAQMAIYQLQKLRDEIVALLRKLGEQKGAFTDAESRAVEKAVLERRLKLLEESPFLPGGTEAKVSTLLNKHKKLLDNVLAHVLEKIPLTAQQKRRCLRLCGLSVFKNLFYGGKSGIVIAGYGEGQLFPSFRAIEIEGRIGRFLKAKTSSDGAIEPKENTAWIAPFAQQEMVSTFMSGFHPRLKEAVYSSLTTLMDSLPGLLMADKTQAERDAIKKKLGTLNEQFRKQIDEFAYRQFVMKILHSVQALPKDELASMAEALVNLTSFKRRVTLDKETVGGPIDVAVISKGDGFVWIKRKHYFDPALNRMFLANYQRGIDDHEA